MNSAEIGSLNLSNEKIRETPVIFGESDVIKTLQLEPGVTSGIEGMANMYAHGGDTDENMYMLDNIPLYQVNHLGGLFSAFNTGAIRNADFYKSSFPPNMTDACRRISMSIPKTATLSAIRARSLSD